MSKQTIIIGIIVLLVIVLGGWYLFTQGPGTPGPASTATTTQSAETGAATPVGTGTGPLKSILSRGGNYTCTFGTVSTAAGTGSNSSGTLYVAAGQSRGEFSVTSNTGTVTLVHVIRSGGMSYTWIEGQPTGIKTPINATTATRINPSGAGFSEDQFASVSWDCHPWVPDPKQFVPPTLITFTES
jgi:hypothetical protein